jgi:hypothetical protein
MIRTSHIKKYYLIIYILILILFIMGIIYFYIVPNTNLNYLETINNFKDNISNFHPELLWTSIVISAVSLILSFCGIGNILLLIYILYSAFNMGFTTGLFIKCSLLKGFGFSLIYNLLYRLIPIMIMTVILYYGIKIFSLIWHKYILKKDNGFNVKIQHYYHRNLILYLIVSFYCLIIYLFGNFVLSFVAFFL